jgi:hypothetical protein
MHIEKKEDKISRLHNSKLMAIGLFEHFGIVLKYHWLRVISSFSAIFFPLFSLAEIFNYTPGQFTDSHFTFIIIGISAVVSG